VPAKIVECPACESEISRRATSCPRCGEPLRKPTPLWDQTWFKLLSLVGLIVGAFLIAQLAMSNDLDRIDRNRKEGERLNDQLIEQNKARHERDMRRLGVRP